MACHTLCYKNHPVLETCYSGALTPSELASALQQTLKIARAQSKSLLLADFTALSHAHSVVDLFTLVDLLQYSGIARAMKQAILLRDLPGPPEDVLHWESACANRGLRVRLFVDRQEATGWLLQPMPAGQPEPAPHQLGMGLLWVRALWNRLFAGPGG